MKATPLALRAFFAAEGKARAPPGPAGRLCASCLRASEESQRQSKRRCKDGGITRYGRRGKEEILPNARMSGTKSAVERHRERLPSVASFRTNVRLFRRSLATVQQENPQMKGPIQEYDDRIHSGKLKDDDHQRMIIQSLQDLHEMLMDYHPLPVIGPTLDSLIPKEPSFFDSLFHRRPTDTSPATRIPLNLPKGLYMYGDVGSGKTMLMDLFFDTLPPNITHKTRIHFHSFMQDVHKRIHRLAMQHGNNIDALPWVAADIASQSSVLCFDEFQCTDVADAMILRRLVEGLMGHGVVIVTTSNRHPHELYKNGIQRESFIPCINLLLTHLRVLNLDSTTDYRKIPRPPSGVFYFPLDKAAKSHANKWFRFLGNLKEDPPHPAEQEIWGRKITVPSVSGSCARFTFQELIGRATGAADYLELMRSYDAFIVTDVPGMTYKERDWARRFITFIDAVYESHAKLVLTTAVPLTQLFLSPEEIHEAIAKHGDNGTPKGPNSWPLADNDHADVEKPMRVLMNDLGMSMEMLKSGNMFSGDEERFAFARALSRLSEMGSQEWVERGMGLENKGGKDERESWQRVRSRWREDNI